MALVKCRECRAQVSTEAEKCPQCGAKVKNRFSTLEKVVVLLICSTVLIVVVSGGPTSTPTKVSGAPERNLDAASKAAPASVPAATQKDADYQPIPFNDFEASVKSKGAKAGTKVSVEGDYYLVSKDLETLMRPAKNDKPAQVIQLTTGNATPNARKFFQECVDRSLGHLGGCPVRILAHAEMCGGTGRDGKWEEWPCLAVEDIRPASAAPPIDCKLV